MSVILSHGNAGDEVAGLVRRGFGELPYSPSPELVDYVATMAAREFGQYMATDAAYAAVRAIDTAVGRISAALVNGEDDMSHGMRRVFIEGMGDVRGRVYPGDEYRTLAEAALFFSAMFPIPLGWNGADRIRIVAKATGAPMEQVVAELGKFAYGTYANMLFLAEERGAETDVPSFLLARVHDDYDLCAEVLGGAGKKMGLVRSDSTLQHPIGNMIDRLFGNMGDMPI